MARQVNEVVVLRDYQQAVIEDARVRWRDRPCIVAPTGAGKTVIGGEIVRRAVARGRAVLWVAHRTELIDQAASRLASVGLEVGIIMAGRRATPSAAVQVASVQTLVRRACPPAALVVVDEAHHVRARTYRRVLEQYPEAAVVGLTATPFRTDGRGLGDVFGALCVAASAQELVCAGTLLEPQFFAPYTPDVKGLRKRGGDYSDSDLGRLMDKPHLVGDVVKTWQARAAGRRTVVFATTVQHSRNIVAAYLAAGVPAAHIDGDTPKAARAQVLADLASGALLVVSNCAVLTEGWDLPALACAVVARPTASLGLHLQMVGRVMRTAPGKADTVVLDHAGNVHRHGLPTDPIEYSLADGVVAKEAQRKKTKTCPACFAVVPAPLRVCACGHLFGRDLVPEERGGELGLVVRGVNAKRAQAPLAERTARYAALLEEASAKGWRAAWAGMRYRDTYGDWPRGDVYPLLQRARAACRHVQVEGGACRFCGRQRGAVPPGV